MMIDRINSYSETSRTLIYSLVLLFPLVIVYELLGFVVNWGNSFELRNGADVFLRQIFLIFGENSRMAYSTTLFGILLVFGIRHRQELFTGNIKVRFLVLMFLEGLCWSVVLFISLGIVDRWLLMTSPEFSVLENIYLGIGAGIFEELLFRLGMLMVLFNAFKIIKISRIKSFVLAVVISAFFFSAFHYIGIYADIFRYESFTFRFTAGLLLGVLFVARGFGITALSHIFYDMIVVSIPVILNQ